MERPQFKLPKHSWLPLVLALTGGCQLLAGIEKAEYDPDWDADTKSGSSESGSTTQGDGDQSSGDGDRTSAGDGDTTESSGGGSSTGDDTDTDTDPGTSGNTDTGSTGGDDLDPVPGLKSVWFSDETCSTELALQQADLDSCLYRVSCDPDTPTTGISACLTFDILRAYPTETCSVGASSCEDIYQCLGRRPLTDKDRGACAARDAWSEVDGEPCEGYCSGTCDGHCSYYDEGGECFDTCTGNCTGRCWIPTEELKWACSDDWAVNCGSGTKTSYDCAAFAAACEEATWSDAKNAGSCKPSEAKSFDCAESTSAYQCADESTLYWCDSLGEAWGFDCPGTCTEGPNGAFCALGNETCNDTNTVGCSGDVLEFCDENGFASSHDCTLTGLNCDGGDCIASGCDSSYCEESCEDGHLLHFCVGGAEVQLDCLDYGFEGCQQWSDTDVEPRARCVQELPAHDDSCGSSKDGFCDEPKQCAPGTDSTDCNNTCAFAHNGVCESAQGCPSEIDPETGTETATDGTDCGDSCQYSLDNACDEPFFCAPGTDTTDCEAANSCYLANNGSCDEGDGCDEGTDTADCKAENSCYSSYNGICDEGDACPVGTDTYDCHNNGP